MSYINSERLKEEIRKFSAVEYNEGTISDIIANNALDYVLEEIIPSLEQEQSEVDLEKFTEKIKTFQERYKHPESISIKGAMAFMARMFYQYPNTARQWCEQLPKVIMD